MTVCEHSYFEGNSGNFYCQGTDWLDILLTNCDLRPSWYQYHHCTWVSFGRLRGITGNYCYLPVRPTKKKNNIIQPFDRYHPKDVNSHYPLLYACRQPFGIRNCTCSPAVLHEPSLTHYIFTVWEYQVPLKEENAVTITLHCILTMLNYFNYFSFI